MGALDDLKDFISTKVFRNKSSADSETQDFPHGRPSLVPGDNQGFPFVNYAYSKRINQDVLTIPRLKYTYIVEFHVNPQALDITSSVTNLKGLIEDNKIYIQLKKIDHPKPRMNFETMRSYNKYVKVPKTMEYPPASMTFDDDATSMAVALWKEYFSFYNHSGDLGWEQIENPQLEGIVGNRFISNDEPGVGYQHLVWNSNGSEPRAKMDERFSMGMKLKANHKRHFFDAITIYDLGTEPDSVNVYYYYHPVITAFDHQELDTEDRTSKVEVNMQFEYENYYFVLGRSRDEIGDTIAERFGVRPPTRTNPINVKDTSHGQMVEPVKTGTVPVSLANPDPQTPTPSITTDPEPSEPDPIDSLRFPDDIQNDIDSLKERENEILRDSAGGSSDAKRAELAEIRSKLKDLDGELNQTNVAKSEIAKTEQAAPATQSAAENTKKELEAKSPPLPENFIQNDANLKVAGRNRDQWVDLNNRASVAQEKLTKEIDILKETSSDLDKSGAGFEEWQRVNDELIKKLKQRNAAITLQRLATESVIQIDKTEGRPFKPL